MTTRQRRALFAWLPRGFLILAALLAPVIDRGGEPEARSSVVEELDVADGAGGEQDSSEVDWSGIAALQTETHHHSPRGADQGEIGRCVMRSGDGPRWA